MTEKSTLRQLEQWGFLRLPAPYPTSLGAGGLLVLIHDNVPNQQFDPQGIHCMLRVPDGSMSLTVLRAGGKLRSLHQVGAGEIRLVDAARESHRFFTFGGTVSPEHDSEESVYYFKSSAPILSLNGNELESQLAVEAEAMLAVERAHSRLDDATFDAHIADQKADDLYRRVLQYVVDRHTVGSQNALYHAVQAELKRLGESPTASPENPLKFLAR
jgi:hypothetical protein